MSKESQLKPEDIRPGEPETRIKDIDKARAMAEAGHEQRLIAVFERQLSKILKQYESKELSREELKAAVNQLVSLYPQSHGESPPFNERPERHEFLSETADKTAEQLEYWTGILLEHPAKGWTAEKLAKKERDAKYCENRAKGVEENEEEFKKMIKEKGFTGFTASAFMGNGMYPGPMSKIPKDIVLEAEDKFRELTKNSETTVKELIDVVCGAFQAGAEYYRKYAKKYNEILNKIREGIFIAKDEQEDE